MGEDTPAGPRALAAIVVSVAMLSMGTMPVAGLADAEHHGLARVIEDALGGVPPTMELTTYGAAGPETTDLSWDDVLVLLETFSGRVDPMMDAPTATQGPDIGVSDGVAEDTCDDASFWLAAINPQGSPVLLSDVVVEPAEPVCGIGPAGERTTVISPADLASTGGDLLYEGCYADLWVLRPPGYCLGSFSGGNTYETVMIGAGRAELAVLRVDAFELYMFAGLGATLTYR